MNRAGVRACTAAVVLLAAAAIAETPRERAQTLSYRVAWNGLPAARATVNIAPEQHAGQPAYTVETTASTNSFVDLFWPFRGMARVVFLARDWTPLQFSYDRKIRGVRSLTTIDFSPAGDRARSLYVKGGVTKKQLDLSKPDLIDPITAVFKARHQPIEVGSKLGYDVFTGESRYRVDLRVDGRDEIAVPAGNFSALRVTPRVMKIRGHNKPPDERLRGATIWITDDAERVLLRIRSDVFIGAVTLDLMSRELHS